jgi:hypothetical protein
LKTWIRKWNVDASNGGTWTVGVKADGSYGCSCPAWKFAKAPKPDCRHIEFVKTNPSCSEAKPRRIVLANVSEVTPNGDEDLLTPLIPFGDLHFSLTVACDLARQGAAREDVKRYLNGNRLSDAQEYISTHGRKVYGPWSPERRRHQGFEIVRSTKRAGGT